MTYRCFLPLRTMAQTPSTRSAAPRARSDGHGDVVEVEPALLGQAPPLALGGERPVLQEQVDQGTPEVLVADGRALGRLAARSSHSPAPSSAADRVKPWLAPAARSDSSWPCTRAVTARASTCWAWRRSGASVWRAITSAISATGQQGELQQEPLDVAVVDVHEVLEEGVRRGARRRRATPRRRPTCRTSGRRPGSPAAR